MITRLDLRHFKCFTKLELPLRSLTLLAGANASGKSSVMQPLVLLHQTMRRHEWSSRLALNGEVVRMGTAAEVIDQISGRDSFEIGLQEEDGTAISWRFLGNRTDMSLRVESVSTEGRPHDPEDAPLRYLLPVSPPPPAGSLALAERLRRLTCLTAERLGPRETYPLDDPEFVSGVGPKGERTAGFLYACADAEVSDGLALEGSPPTRLRQVEARMNRFFPGCRLAVEKVPRASAVSLRLATSLEVEPHLPAHTGFGLSQVLPIIVAALSAEKKDLLLIENPEIHLHPAGQASMGEFLAEIAAAGRQVILETHSDHVLNGVRRAVKQGKLSCENAALHFFRPREGNAEGKSAQVETLRMDQNGRIDTWLEGFFDQFDKDLNYFADWTD